MRLYSDQGEMIDAEFDININDPIIIVHSAGHGQNAGYNDLISILFCRLGGLQFSLNCAYVVAAPLPALHPLDELIVPGIEFPINLAGVADYNQLRIQICDNAANVFAEGNNAQRRIQFNLNRAVNADEIACIIFGIIHGNAQNYGFREGAVNWRQHLVRERNIAARNQFLGAVNNWICSICDNDMALYGNDVHDLFEVHHNIPLNQIQGEHLVHLANFRLLCPNCHRAIHRTDNHAGGILTVEAYHQILNPPND